MILRWNIVANPNNFEFTRFSDLDIHVEMDTFEYIRSWKSLRHFPEILRKHDFSESLDPIDFLDEGDPYRIDKNKHLTI